MPNYKPAKDGFAYDADHEALDRRLKALEGAKTAQGPQLAIIAQPTTAPVMPMRTPPAPAPVASGVQSVSADTTTNGFQVDVSAPTGAVGLALAIPVQTDARTALGLGTAAVKDVPAAGNATAGQVVLGNDSRLGGSALSIDYISGLYLRYSSTTAFVVDSGTAYVTLAGTGVTVTSPFTVTPSTGAGIDGGGTISLANNTLYYVHLVSATTVEITTTAPTSYQGTAWESAATNRYIGSFLTDGSAHIINFRRSGNFVGYKADTAVAPYGITLTPVVVSTSQSLTGIVPTTCRLVVAVVDITAPAVAVAVAFGTSDGLTPTAAAGSPLVQAQNEFGGPTTHGSFPVDLDASQAFLYICNIGVTGLLFQLLGYHEDR